MSEVYRSSSKTASSQRAHLARFDAFTFRSSDHINETKAILVNPAHVVRAEADLDASLIYVSGRKDPFCVTDSIEEVQRKLNGVAA